MKTRVQPTARKLDWRRIVAWSPVVYLVMYPISGQILGSLPFSSQELWDLWNLIYGPLFSMIDLVLNDPRP